MIFNRIKSVNSAYLKRVGDCVQNLSSLLRPPYKDLAELFFVRKTIPLGRLTAVCDTFNENIAKLHQARLERRQRNQQKQR